MHIFTKIGNRLLVYGPKPSLIWRRPPSWI